MATRAPEGIVLDQTPQRAVPGARDRGARAPEAADPARVTEFYVVLPAGALPRARRSSTHESSDGSSQTRAAGLLLLRALEESRQRRWQGLQRLGDTSLFVAGFFGDSLARAPVDSALLRRHGGDAPTGRSQPRPGSRPAGPRSSARCRSASRTSSTCCAEIARDAGASLQPRARAGSTSASSTPEAGGSPSSCGPGASRSSAGPARGSSVPDASPGYRPPTTLAWLQDGDRRHQRGEGAAGACDFLMGRADARGRRSGASMPTEALLVREVGNRAGRRDSSSTTR